MAARHVLYPGWPSPYSHQGDQTELVKFNTSLYIKCTLVAVHRGVIVLQRDVSLQVCKPLLVTEQNPLLSSFCFSPLCLSVSVHNNNSTCIDQSQTQSQTTNLTMLCMLCHTGGAVLPHQHCPLLAAESLAFAQ